jgi:hypothetical protein
MARQGTLGKGQTVQNPETVSLLLHTTHTLVYNIKHNQPLFSLSYRCMRLRCARHTSHNCQGSLI